MDAARSTRKYPAYTTEQLKEFIAKDGDNANPVMVKEVADREAGISVPRFTPQIEGGLVIPRLGRM
jgi:hypothetical protein